MSTKASDKARWFYGERLKASGLPRKAIAGALHVTPQAVSKHFAGRVDGLSYAQLRGLAETNLKAALAVVNGARVECETAAVEGRSIMDLCSELVPLLDAETFHDGHEDCAQMNLATILGTVAFMQDHLSISVRHQLAKRLDAWVTDKLAEIDAATAAIARARALRDQLEPSRRIA